MENGTAGIFMFSDTTKLKDAVTRPALENIRKNNYTVFHGIIKSKNTIPIQIVK
jgi:hypothetical protein